MKDSKKKPNKGQKKSPSIPNLLGELQDQIDQTTSEDEKGRALLRDLIAVTHPTLTLALSYALTILSTAGI